MKIFKQGSKVRLQLMHFPSNSMLFDFTVEQSEFEELREHIIVHLKNFQL